MNTFCIIWIVVRTCSGTKNSQSRRYVANSVSKLLEYVRLLGRVCLEHFELRTHFLPRVTSSCCFYNFWIGGHSQGDVASAVVTSLRSLRLVHAFPRTRIVFWSNCSPKHFFLPDQSIFIYFLRESLLVLANFCAYVTSEFIGYKYIIVTCLLRLLLPNSPWINTLDPHDTALILALVDCRPISVDLTDAWSKDKELIDTLFEHPCWFHWPPSVAESELWLLSLASHLLSHSISLCRSRVTSYLTLFPTVSNSYNGLNVVELDTRKCLIKSFIRNFDRKIFCYVLASLSVNHFSSKRITVWLEQPCWVGSWGQRLPVLPSLPLDRSKSRLAVKTISYRPMGRFASGSSG